MAAVGSIFSIVGTVLGMSAAKKQAKAMKESEKMRAQQLQNETNRRTREAIRQSNVARAEATSNAYNQGAGESSALQGGLAQVSGAAGRNVQAAQQDNMTGQRIFKLNQKIADAQGMAAIGQGISSLGGAFASLIGPLDNMFAQGRAT